MAKGVYTCIDGVSRNVKKIPVCIDGVSRSTKAGYACVDSVSRQFFPSGTPVSSLEVGSTVYMNVDNVQTEFLVVHQGLPSTVYDASCDGTWLLMKDLYEKRTWDSSNNDFANSDIHSYLNGTFLGLFDADIQSAIKQVKLPYHKGTGSSGSIASGISGLSAKIFPLSGYEVGWTTSTNRYFPVDGAKLSYFESGTATSANNKRVGYYNGTATVWWLRSPYTNNTMSPWIVRTDGHYNYVYSTGTFGVRPALILPSNTVVDENFNIIA